MVSRLFCGAAGQIRTADLILTKKFAFILPCVRLCLYIPSGLCAIRIFVLSSLSSFYLILGRLLEDLLEILFRILHQNRIPYGVLLQSRPTHLPNTHTSVKWYIYPSRLRSSNIVLTDRAFFVSFLILSSSALLFTRRRLFSEERSAAFVFCKWSMNQSSAISSTSTRTFLGSPFTAKQERAGFPTKYFAYTSLKAAKSVISLK